MTKFKLLVISPLLSTALLLWLSPAFAQQDNSQAFKQTHIETVSGSSEIWFYVEGELAAVLDSDGLHVRGEITYGDTLIDSGREGFEKYANPPSAAPINKKDGTDAE